jgi:phosphonoacetaldehyde hydrolase
MPGRNDNERVKNMVQAVIFDWAGTTIDYGCFAPVAAFVEAFKNKDIAITVEEARIPMGLPKRDHISEIFQMERVASIWQEKYGKLADEADIDNMYVDFETMLLSTLKEYATPIPGAIEVVEQLRVQHIKIGSTTGYTSGMMNIIVPEAERQGYAPDMLVTPDMVDAGRPYPWMCYLNAMRLGVYPMHEMVKVGDTVSDMREAINAGVWAVGVIKGGNELGMNEAEIAACPPDKLAEKMRTVRKRFEAAGAHYVIESIHQLPDVVNVINERLKQREYPIFGTQEGIAR